jgi:hypothetical protein
MALPIHAVTMPAAVTGQANGKLPDNRLVSTPGQLGGPVVRLVAPAARAWRAMCAAALAAGHTLKATSVADSYRSYAVQESTFRARYSTSHLANRPTAWWQGRTWWLRPGMATAAVPGTSNHGWGLAVDIGDELDGDAGTEAIDTATVNWLVANAARFGFSGELQSEPWHWRYYPGDTIPPAVAAYEQHEQQGDDDDMAGLPHGPVPFLTWVDAIPGATPGSPDSKDGGVYAVLNGEHWSVGDTSGLSDLYAASGVKWTLAPPGEPRCTWAGLRGMAPIDRDAVGGPVGDITPEELAAVAGAARTGAEAGVGQALDGATVTTTIAAAAG